MKTLLGSGIQPDFIICRTKNPLKDFEIEKISLMTNVEEDCVISSVDIQNKYFLPQHFYEHKFDEKILKKLNFLENHNEIGITQWLELP